MTDSDDATAVLVLVVEDETLIRLLANDMLSEAGYRVLEARDGQEALTILEVHADVRALFTDVTMPNLDGLSLASYFRPDAVVGGDGPFPRKPDPAALCHLAAQADVPLRDTVLVGDSAIDWRTARAAGAAACLVRYGFGFQAVPLDQLGAEDRVISAPNELMSL